MRRREFLTLLGGAAATWPLAAGAQQRRELPVVGWLGLGQNQTGMAAFRKGLNEQGYAEGRNVVLEIRETEQYDQLPARAAELVRRPVAVIFTSATTNAAQAAKAATGTIPIVFTVGSDPVQMGLVASLNRPGGNITGMTFLTMELEGKRIDLLTQMVPQATTVAYLSGPSSSLQFEEQTGEILEAARALGREIIVQEVRTNFEFEVAFATLVQRGVGALVVGTFPWFFESRDRILALAARHQIPAMYPSRAFVLQGGLMSYSAGRGIFRQVGSHYVGQILKGVKPSDLPVQQPTKFEFVINLRTARALGLRVPPMLVARADEVIE
jgi:ABC-type uncharacterized transport system substrate-binding protein